MKSAKLLAAGLVWSLLGVAHAQNKGDWQVSTGWLHIDSNLTGGPLTVTNPPLGAQPNTGATSNDPDTLGVQLTYFITDHVAAETWLGVPPKVKFYGTGNLSAPAINPIATARSWAPMALLKYYFGQPESKFHPFAGGGVAYKFATDVNINPTFQQQASLEFSGGKTASAPSDGEFKPGFAPVLSVGANYNFDQHWGLTASLTYLHFTTVGTITTHMPTGNVISKVDVRENPLISFVGGSYRF